MPSEEDHNADLEALWNKFVAEAKQALPPKEVAGSALIATAPGASEDSHRYDIDVAPPEHEYLPPTLQPSRTVEHELTAQRRYIVEVEKLLAEGAQPGSRSAQCTERPGTAISLRQTNRMLRAKVEYQQQQLLAAHGRCRRAEEINAQWRAQHAELRKREREQHEQLTKALNRLQRSEDLCSSVARLRDCVRLKTADLENAHRRIKDLEQAVEYLRGMLANSHANLPIEELERRSRNSAIVARSRQVALGTAKA